MRDKITRSEMNWLWSLVFTILIVVIITLIAVRSINDEMSKVPHKYCKEQFIKCWYEDNPNIVPNCYFKFNSIEGYPIEGELKHIKNCDNGNCYESYSREVCKIE